MLKELFNFEKILGTCEKFLYFLEINVLFLISNLPVLLFLLFQGISRVREYLPFFLLCLLPAGPAMSAVFFSMNRILHGTETNALKDYKTGYIDSFRKKVLLTAIWAGFIWVFYTNVEFFNILMRLPPLAILFFILFAGVLIMTPTLFLLASRYDMSVRGYLKGAVYLTVTKPLLAFGNVIALAFILMLLEIRAGTFVLFMASIYGFLIVFMNRNVLHKIDDSADKEK